MGNIFGCLPKEKGSSPLYAAIFLDVYMKTEILYTFDKFNSDLEKWNYLLTVQDSGIIVFLDNDYTFVGFEDYDQTESFNSWVGNSDGVLDLLNILGIRCELV